MHSEYALLLSEIGRNLLSSDVVKLKDWAGQNYSIVNIENPKDILLQLDEQGIINASDLSELREFFEFIGRWDFIYIIDEFLLGEYGPLYQISRSGPQNSISDERNQPLLPNTLPIESNSKTSGTQCTDEEYQRFLFSVHKLLYNPSDFTKLKNWASRNFSIDRENTQNATDVLLELDKKGVINASNLSPLRNFFESIVRFDLVYYIDEFLLGNYTLLHRVSVMKKRDATKASQNPQHASQCTRALSSLRQTSSQHISTLARKAASSSSLQMNTDQNPVANLKLESNWLCSHYERHCYVKFECCDKFWPCHRCHNNQSTCGQKKLKSRDTQMVKCASCEKVQPFGKTCCHCSVGFSSYFCGVCKHLTGYDDDPYHCDKCGICRIHGDLSFHCDVCGICLDVQLRGNHKCRQGSAHDECCICLEDAFTGCQILPCSHKVHKECATQMIRRGITRCPICRESFAHKLERRPLPSRKRPGK